MSPAVYRNGVVVAKATEFDRKSIGLKILELIANHSSKPVLND